jgi:Trk K+ transport system NAD-binding subunit
MSVLLVGATGGLGRSVALRLVAQGDEVRVVEPDPRAVAAWRALGVHVARGEPDDEDLLFRAAQNARTIVLLDGPGRRLGAVTAAVVRAAALVPVGRIVVCAPVVPAEALEVLRSSGLEYVALSTGRRLLGRGGTPDEVVAEAVDAADDLSGALRLELDLTEPEAYRVLKIPPRDR